MQPQVFQVTVRGHLSPQFAAGFEGVTVRSEGGLTTLTGVFRDQAQLYGVLERVADYGLELTEVVPDRPLPTGPVRAPAVGSLRRPLLRLAGFLVTFAAGWAMLVLIPVSPPQPVPALAALVAAALALMLGSVALLGARVRGVLGALGLGRPSARALVVALLAGGAAVLVPLLGAALTGMDLRLRADWLAVLLGILIFHGVAEELVWRGFAFAHLRRNASFRTALLQSMPLIALTHVPIIIGNGWLVGGLAVLTAAVTCIPFSYLWEHGHRTIWAPALLHASIDFWQLFERDYPPTFPVLVMLAAIVVAPLAVWLLGRRMLPVTADGAARTAAPA